MLESHDQRKKQLLLLALVGRCIISCIFVLLTQFALSLVPYFFSASSLFLQLIPSALVFIFVVGFGRWCRRLLGFYASAPAFVLFNILFIWVIYIIVVRPAIPHFLSIVFNGEIAFLLFGLCRILFSDPGFIANEWSDSEEHGDTKDFEVEVLNKGSGSLKRLRYCKSCKAYVKGFDHHCPALGNCIGQNNYVLFMALLVGFVTTESSYIFCSYMFAKESRILDGTRLENNLAGRLVISTMLFSLLQVLWQVVFVIWHAYCICFNIRTDEWINWEKYPEFQLNQSQPGEIFTRMRFTNPYDNGILQNVKEFLAGRG